MTMTKDGKLCLLCNAMHCANLTADSSTHSCKSSASYTPYAAVLKSKQRPGAAVPVLKLGSMRTLSWLLLACKEHCKLAAVGAVAPWPAATRCVARGRMGCRRLIKLPNAASRTCNMHIRCLKSMYEQDAHFVHIMPTKAFICTSSPHITSAKVPYVLVDKFMSH